MAESKAIYPAVAYVVDPAMQADRPGGKARGYGGVGSEVLELEENVFLDQSMGHVVARGIGVFGTNHTQRGIGIPQPALDGGHGGERGRGRIAKGLHGAAVGMTADDDIRDLEGETAYSTTAETPPSISP